MRKPSKESSNRFVIFAGTLVVLAAALIGASLMAGQAKQDDSTGEKMHHTACLVMDKKFTPNRYGRDYSTYKVKTSCGEFVTDASLFDAIAEDQSYDLTVTAGNWANKPSLVSVEGNY